MKEKLKLFFSFKLLQIKQLFHHKTRTIMLLMSLTFSFTLLMVCLFSTVNFGKYAFYFARADQDTTILREDNKVRKNENGGTTIITDEEFLSAMEEASKNSLVEESIFCYQTIEWQEVTYEDKMYSFKFNLYNENDMHLNKASENMTKALNVKNFLYGDFPKNENEIALNETVLRRLNIDPNTVNKESEITIKVDGKDFLLAGVISDIGLIAYNGIMFKSAVDQEISLDSVYFYARSKADLDDFKAYLVSNGINLDNIPDNSIAVVLMIAIECILVILAISITLVSMLMYYSNFRSLIKECEKQTCITFYLGYSKKKTIRDLLFKLCVIGTIAFVLATILASIVGLWINTQKALVFAGMPLYSVALINPLAVFIGYIVAMLLLLLLFYKPIKKITLKMPNSFGGSL